MKEENDSGPPFPSRISLGRDVLWIASVAVVYFATARLSLLFVFEPEGIAAIWPPSGIFLSALLLTRRGWRPYLAGALLFTGLLAEMLAGTPWAVSAIYALALTGDAVLSTWLLLRLVGAPLAFTKVREVLGFLALAVVLSNSLMSIVAAAAAELLPGTRSFASSWQWWAASTGVGNLLVTPFLLSWTAWWRTRRETGNPKLGFEGVASCIELALLQFVAFRYLAGHRLFTLFLPYLTFPFLLWAAFRFGVRGVATALVILAGVAVPFAAAGLVPGFSMVPGSLDDLIGVQLFLALAAVFSLFLAAIVTEREQTREALRLSEERFRVIATHTPDHILVQDADLRYGWVLNPQLGLTEADMIGKTDFDFLGREDAERLTKIKRQVLASGEPVRVEVPLVSLEGGTEYFAGTYVPKHGPDGKVDGLIGYFQNVTERKRAEETLRESAERHRILLQVAMDGFWMTDLQGRLLEVNDAYGRMSGYSTQELLAMRIADVEVGETADDTSAHVRKVMAQGEDRFESQHRRKDGTVFDVEVSVQYRPIEDGRLVVFLRDITERKRAEESLRRSEERLQRAHRAARLGNWEWDVLTNELYWSQENYPLHGIDPEKVKPSYDAFIQVVDPAEREFVNKTVADALAGKKPLDFDYTCIRPDNGKKCIINSRADVILDSAGQAVKMAGTVQDVTARRQAEAALRESEERFRLMFETHGAVMLLMEPQTGAIVDANAAAARFYGYSRDHLRTLRIEDINQLPAEQVAAERAAAVAEQRNHFVFPHRLANGESRWVEVYSSPVQVRGRTLLFSIVHDTTERKKAEEALREREEIYSAIVNQAADGIVLVDACSGRLVEFNQVAHESLGYSRQEFAQLVVADIDVGIGPERLPDHMAATFAHGRVEFETRQRCRNGDVRDTRVSVRSLNLRGGDYFAAIWSDITERKRAEDQLREKTVIAQTFMDALPCVALLLKPGTREIVALNKTAREAGAQLGATCFGSWAKSDQACWFCLAPQAWETGTPQTLEVEALGTVWEAHWVPVAEELYLHYALDITERKRAADALRLAGQRLALHVEQTPLAVVEFDITGRVREWNPAAVAIFGFSREEALGRFWHFMVPEPVWAQLDGVWEGLVTQRGGSRSTNENRTKDGRTIYCEWFNTPLVDAGGQTIGVASLVQDVTDRHKAEAALRESEEKYRSVFDNALVGMFRTRVDGSEMLDANERLLDIFGRTREEMLGLSSEVHWADPRERQEMLDQVRTQGRVADFECRLLNKRGEVMTCLMAVRLYPEQGILEGSIRDISDRRRAEESLRESEERFRRIFEEGPIGIATSGADFRFVRANAAFCELMGRTESELRGLTFRDLTHPEDLPRDVEPVQRLLRGEIPVYRIEKRYVRHGTEVVWGDATITVVRDREGQFQYFVVMIENVTERKRVETALREGEARYHALFEQAGDFTLVLETGPEGIPIIVDVNEATLLAHGYAREELLGKPISFMDVEVSPAIASERTRALKTKGQTLLTVRHRRKDGSLFDVEARVKLVRIGPKDVFLSVERDVTERKRAEERLRVYQRQLRTLASQLSLAEERERRRIAAALHDHTCQSLVLARMKLDELLEAMSIGQAAAFRGVGSVLSDTIEQVRELTFDLSSPTLYKFGLAAALEELLEDKFGAQQDVTYDFSDDRNPKPLTEDVQVLLFQSVREVLINILKHAQAHKVNLDIRRTEGSIRIAVADDGVGFDVDEVSSLPARQRGFGLFSIKERLDCIGGVLEIDSQRGVGSRFILVAPLDL